MPPASRGRAANPAGSVWPLMGGYGRARGGAGGGGAPAGGVGDGRCSKNAGLLSVLGLLVVATIWLTTQVRDGDTNKLPTMKNPTMPAGGNSKGTLQATSVDNAAGADDGGDLADGIGVEESQDGELEISKRWASEQSHEGPGSPGYPMGDDDIHVVFSTDCRGYQSWQAVTLFHSAILSGHKGPITQLVSGCTPEQEAEITARHELSKHTSKHKLHFSPNFAITNPVTGEPYPYLNKPNAMQRWLNDTDVSETIIALIDPDFIFLKPLTTFMSPTEVVVRGDGLSIEGLGLEKGEWIRKGFPAGQRFGLPNWTHWNRSTICPADSVCATATTAMDHVGITLTKWKYLAVFTPSCIVGATMHRSAKRYWDLIPPYLAHKDDWRMLLPVWVEQAPKVYDTYPSLLAEQTAYATAAATLDLRHYRLNNYAIESEKVDYESWDAVDHNIGNVCEVGIEAGDRAKVDLRAFQRIPNFIHYCHMYRVGHWLFNKRRYRKDEDYDQLLCSTPLLAEPPPDTQENAYKMHPGARYESITPRTAKRNAFVLCVATRFVNSALRRFKDKVCEEGAASYEQTVRIT